MTATPSDAVPLARLLLMAGRSLVDELHVRLRAQGWQGIRPAYGFVLVALKDGALSNTALAERLDVTKQATSKLIDAMVADGLVVRTVDARDSRARVLQLSERGRRLLNDVEKIYIDVEAEWAEIIGERALRQISGRLVRVLQSVHGGTLPPVRP